MTEQQINKSQLISKVVITVLLIDDQAMVGEAVRRMLAAESDIVFHYCADATQALRMAKEINPTVILQDWVMPEVDGPTLVRYFRASAGLKDIPLIVLSSKEDPLVKAEAFALGANDYLVKLPDKIELIARIRYHSKGYINLLERNEVLSKLNKELAEASDYVQSLIPAPFSQEDMAAEWRYIPSTTLGGDILGYHWIDSDHFAMYLLDVCGHGVGAALLSVTALNVLRYQTLPNTDFRQPDAVMDAMNETFQMDRHNQMYFTMWYGVFNPKEKQLSYASAGHPAPLLFKAGAESAPLQLSTRGMIVGGMPGIKFNAAQVKIENSADLFIFSDGVYEIELSDGSTWDYDSFVAYMSSLKAENKMDTLLKHARKLRGANTLDDDFSILHIRIGK